MVFMKVLQYITLGIVTIFVFFSCKKDDIDVYRIEDSAAQFSAATNAFSLRGNTEPVVTLQIPLKLVGRVVDYDRPVNVIVSEHPRNTAVEGRDFKIVEAVVKAGAMSGYILVEVNDLKDGVEELMTTFQIQPNEHFRTGMKGYNSSIVSWSEMYARPQISYVWDSWYNFFCNGYSRNLHSVLITVFGEEIETISYKNVPDEIEDTYGIEHKTIDWWYAASRQLREYVRDYDREHPDSPLMHSDDYEVYANETVAVGEGQKPDVIPTIYETLLVY